MGLQYADIPVPMVFNWEVFGYILERIEILTESSGWEEEEEEGDELLAVSLVGWAACK